VKGYPFDTHHNKKKGGFRKFTNESGKEEDPGNRQEKVINSEKRGSRGIDTKEKYRVDFQKGKRPLTIEFGGSEGPLAQLLLVRLRGVSVGAV